MDKAYRTQKGPARYGGFGRQQNGGLRKAEYNIALMVAQTCYNPHDHCRVSRWIAGLITERTLQTRSHLAHERSCMVCPLQADRFPILEYDPERVAFIDPASVIKARDVPEHCVLCFFSDVIDRVVAERKAMVLVENRWEDGPHPLYEIEYADQRLAFFHPGIGGPLASSLLEEVIGFGCRKFIACGGCGVLEADIAVGNLIVVTAAVRDEGVSYHYLPAGREVAAHGRGVKALEATLRARGAPYRLGKTWTTSAPYRETHARIARRRNEDCITVEMEAASLMAVAQYRNVIFGQVLYGGDDLSGESWEHREWQHQAKVREALFWMAADACLSLKD